MTLNKHIVVKSDGYKLQQAFTLIEILLVVVIMGSLAAMVFPRLVGRSEQAKVAVAKADITINISTGLKLYQLDNDMLPTTEQGLDALLTKPTLEPVPMSWNGPYLERKPLDPWNKPYVYKSPGAHRPDYDLYSLGRDGKESDDDVKNWE